MTVLPNYNSPLIDSRDFILSTSLAKKALSESFLPGFTNILRDIIEEMYYLAKSCHLPEFTEHGLPHVCSVVKRISDWGDSVGWLEKLKDNEASILLLAAIVHDIGMLTQNKADLEEQNFSDYNTIDIPLWVRSTHSKRIFKILDRTIIQPRYNQEMIRKGLKLVSEIARAHSVDQEQYENNLKINDLCSFFKLDKQRQFALASIISVADLLDEDGERCDTKRLLENKHSTTISKAHWIRHTMTHRR
ncbi:MAG: HD domain-containing protein, partial [Firmicutes bacterium]|nr:HD domain-containing protein [Bacillota bacterium]